MTDVTNIGATWGDLLEQVVLTSAVDWVVALDLVREGSSLSSLESEGLDELVFGGIEFTINNDSADVDSTDEFTNDKGITSFTSVVGVVVVHSVGEWFQVVSTVEELGDIGTTGSLDDELATWVVWGVVSSIQNEIVEQEKVALASAGDSVELLLGDSGEWGLELNVLAHVQLVTDLHDNKWDNEGDWRHNPKVVPLHSVGVVGIDTGGSAVDSNQDEQPGEVLVNVTEAHQKGRVAASLPSAEVGNETGKDEWDRHKWDGHSTEGVEVRSGATLVSLGADVLEGAWHEAILVMDSPEAPVHSSEADH